MYQFKLVIFDWDGTLMDSIARIVSSVQAAARTNNFRLPSDQEAKSIIGLSLPQAVAQLFPETSITQQNNFIQTYKSQYVELNTTASPLFDGVKPLLARLQQEDKLLAVATGKGRAGLERVWQATNTGHFFHASRCAGEVASKPEPEMLTSLLTELQVLPSEAVMIGDTRYDMEMAQRAGVARIGVTLGVDDRDVLSDYQPIAIVDSLSELDSILQ